MPMRRLRLDDKQRELGFLMAEAKTKSIETEAGILELVPAALDQLRDIPRYWPTELLSYAEGSPDFGLVFQHEAEEVWGSRCSSRICPGMMRMRYMGFAGSGLHPRCLATSRCGIRA